MNAERKQISLVEIFSTAQLNKIRKIIKDHPDDLEQTKIMKRWFHEPDMVKQLDNKGLIPDYAAYLVIYIFNREK